MNKNILPKIGSKKNFNDPNKFKGIDENLKQFSNIFKNLTNLKKHKKNIISHNIGDSSYDKNSLFNYRLKNFAKILNSGIIDVEKEEDNTNEEQNNLLDFLNTSTGVVLVGVGILVSGMLFKLFFPDKFEDMFQGFPIASKFTGLRGGDIGITPMEREAMGEAVFTGKFEESFTEEISVLEGTAGKKGWNSSFNNWADWNNIRRGKEIKNMTLREILDLQDRALKLNNPRISIRGTISRAIGKIQIQSDTIKYLLSFKKNGKPVFTLDTIFNEETQRKMAGILLNRRGFNDYVSNPTNKEEIFIENLGLEWEGFKKLSHDRKIRIVRQMRSDFLQTKKSPEIQYQNQISAIQKQSIKKHIAFVGADKNLTEEFNKLEPRFEQKIINLSEEYYQMTGKKLAIQSAFRTQQHNKEVKGSISSRHLRGAAIDLMNAEDARFLQRTGLLKKYGLESLGLKGKREWTREVPHIQEVSQTSIPTPISTQTNKISTMEKTGKIKQKIKKVNKVVADIKNQFPDTTSNINGLNIIHDDPLINYDILFRVGIS